MGAEATWLACSASSGLSRPARAAGFAAAAVAVLAGALAATSPHLALALVAGAALVGAVLWRPFVGGMLLVAVVPALSGLAPGIPLPNLRLSEVLIGAVCVCLLTSLRRRDRLRFDTLDWLLLAYGVVWAVFGVLGARDGGGHLTLSQCGTVAGQLQFFLLYRGVQVSVRTAAQRTRALHALVAAAVVVSVLAIAEEARLPGLGAALLHLTGATAPAGLLRASGPFDNWAALAGYLLPVLLVAGALRLSGSPVGRSRAMMGAMAVMAIALFTTLELSAIACLFAAVLWLGIRYGRRQALMGVGGAAVLGALVASPLLVARVGSELAPTPGLPRDHLLPQTIAFRLSVWSEYFRALGGRLLEGYGVVLPATVAWPFPESQYVALLIEGGVPMLLAFAALNATVIVLCRRACAAGDLFDSALGHGLLAMSVLLVALDLIWPYFSNGGFPQVFCGLLALGSPAWARRPRASVALPAPAFAAGSLA